MLKGKDLAGRHNFDGYDYYSTPKFAVQALLDRESFKSNSVVWEPCAGNGRMSKVLEKDERFKEVFSSELRNDDLVYGVGGTDFLQEKMEGQPVDYIITNPPFSKAQEIIEHALTMANHKVCMFLKLVFLEGIGRYNTLWTKTPLKCVYPFSYRVQLYNDMPGVERPKNSGTTAYCWMVWDKSLYGKPQPYIEWIEDKPVKDLE